MKKTLGHISFTQETNALDYLEKAYFFTSKIYEDEYAWKWIVLALHGALYGFAVSACRGTNNLGVEKNGWLISFDDALKKCQDSELMNMTVISKPLILTSQQQESINFMKKELRNSFEHYIPMTWGILVEGLHQVMIDILDVIYFLALETGNYVNLDVEQQKRVKFCVNNSKSIFLEHKKLYGY